MEEKVAAAKKVLENAEASKEELDASAEEVLQASHKMAERLYQESAGQQAADAAAGPTDASGPAGGDNEPAKTPPSDVIDAEYDEVK